MGGFFEAMMRAAGWKIVPKEQFDESISTQRIELPRLNDSSEEIASLRSQVASLTAEVERLKDSGIGECPKCHEECCTVMAMCPACGERLGEVATSGYTKMIEKDLSRLRASSADPARVERAAVREEVAWFAERMEKKLKANDHKDHWTTCEAEWLFDRMQDEREELLAAMPNEPWRLTDEQRERIIDEAADVANFAMMIADIARQALRVKALAAADGEEPKP